MLGVIKLSVVVLSVFILGVIFMIDLMLNVILLKCHYREGLLF